MKSVGPAGDPLQIDYASGPMIRRRNVFGMAALIAISVANIGIAGALAVSAMRLRGDGWLVIRIIGVCWGFGLAILGILCLALAAVLKRFDASAKVAAGLVGSYSALALIVWVKYF